MSTNADIPDFRSSQGRYTSEGSKREVKELFKASVFANAGASEALHEVLQDIYNASLVAAPTPFHELLFALHTRNQLQRVYTQNMDDLEGKAGFRLSRNTSHLSRGDAIQLYGSVSLLICSNCRHLAKLANYLDRSGYPCPLCGHRTSSKGRPIPSNGILRPAVTLNDMTDIVQLNHASIDDVMQKDISSALDLVLVAGPSLTAPEVRSFLQTLKQQKAARASFVFVGKDIPTTKLANIFDYIVQGDCDTFACTCTSTSMQIRNELDDSNRRSMLAASLPSAPELADRFAEIFPDWLPLHPGPFKVNIVSLDYRHVHS